MINKVNMDTLKEEFNFSEYIPLHKHKYNNKNQKYIFVERNNEDQIINKIHISINDIKNLLCKYNDKCFDKSCSLIHIVKPDFIKNYNNYIILEKKKNILFKSESCKNGDNCVYHMKNKCKYRHNDDPI